MSRFKELVEDLDVLRSEWERAAVRHDERLSGLTPHLTEMGRAAPFMEVKTMRGCSEDLRALMESIGERR